MLLDYIEALEAGARISVRELAAQLRVSEGTAYKAVKDAEQRGLVAVKPKVGTVRVNTEPPALEKAIRPMELMRTLGLAVSAGKGGLQGEIRRLVVCDGSEESLLRQLSGQEPRIRVGLCGDRPELIDAVLAAGANLLLTGGARANPIQIQNAEREGLFILNSLQSSFALLHQLEHAGLSAGSLLGIGPVSDWMQTPVYLYYNDITADWQRLYFEGDFLKQYPLVDDNMEICGGLDLWKATASVPSQRLRSMMADTEAFPRVSARDELKDVAQKFVVDGNNFAAVLEGRRLVGILTATDLLRCYMNAGAAAPQASAASFLMKDRTVSDDRVQIYRIRIPDAELGRMEHLEMNLMLTAAGNHLKEAGFAAYHLESGTFYATRRMDSAEGLMLSSRLQRSNAHNCIVEVEINDDRLSYAKFVLIASAEEKGQEENHVSTD